MALSFRRRLETSIRDLAAPIASANQLLLEQQRYLQSFGDMANQLLSQVREQRTELSQLSREVAELYSAVGNQVTRPSAEAGEDPKGLHNELSQDRMMAELAHSLGTPMSGLKARVLSLCDMYGEDQAAGLHVEMRALKARIEMCEAVLATFRRVVSQTAVADRNYRQLSIAESLILAHGDADRRLGFNTQLECDIPASINGFDNEFITTLLLPLIDNAVEGSPENGTVELQFADETTYVMISINNAMREPVVMEKVITPGESTKDGHDGLGFPTAKWLAHSIRGGSLNASINGGRFHVMIRLPRRSP